MTQQQSQLQTSSSSTIQNNGNPNQNIHLNNNKTSLLLTNNNRTTTTTIHARTRTWKYISMYIIIIITLGMFVISSRNGSQVINNITLSTSGSYTLQPKSIQTKASSSSHGASASSHGATSSSANINTNGGVSGDDNWKLGLYTNRTLGRDYDPLLVVVYDTLKTSAVNYSSRLFKTSSTSLSITRTRQQAHYTTTGAATTLDNNNYNNNGEIITTADDLLFNSCSGTTLRHYCRIKTSQLLQDLTFMAHMSMFQNLGHHATAHHMKTSLNPQLKHLIALAVYGDETVDITDFWESLSLLDILLSDIYDYIPDKNR
ncbi:uncharacterized protein LOC123296119 [Chrysoperla carnea]|uniref:uncharacterized protein LOC123296119 n=1 Tax=Chrysoperla carnea TaxID=189513 RepID=UPI001D070137|nr:uncharacterized protein LOC123296119 [Chrysoperla carnea]